MKTELYLKKENDPVPYQVGPHPGEREHAERDHTPWPFEGGALHRQGLAGLLNDWLIWPVFPHFFLPRGFCLALEYAGNIGQKT